MPLIVNGTTIPTNVANAFSFNGTNITNVICNGTTVWTQSLAPSSIDVLVVAGGGGYRIHYELTYQGGGGAGGLCYQTGRSISSGTTYTVTIGGGGAYDAPGSNSIFDTITALGGGRPGGDGGSGGGGWTDWHTWLDIPPGKATQRNSGGATGYGNAGGAVYLDHYVLSGGGAGSAGGGHDNPGAGVGRSYDISGSSVEYARGGHVNVTPGANSGWGGGYGDYPSPGGSGVVILRYPNTYPTATVTGSPTYTNTGGYHIYKFTGSGTIRW